jgi:hypothetical protein
MRTSRVQKAQERINRFPYKYEAIDDAYARFLRKGTLPEDNTLAARVLYRVLHARKPLPPYPEDLERPPLYQPAGTTREMLFSEACGDDKEIRDFARFLLRILVEDGQDPTDADLIGPEMEPWEYAPVCLRLVGFPHDHVRPQYRAQLERLLERRAAERATRPRNSEGWGPGAQKALAAFMKDGVLPPDQFFQYVMGIAESFALAGDFFGKLGEGVEDLIAAFDIIATGSGQERAAALQRIGRLQVATRAWRKEES